MYRILCMEVGINAKIKHISFYAVREKMKTRTEGI